MKSNNFIKFICFAVILAMQLNISYSAETEYFKSNPNIKVGLIFGSGARASFQTVAENGFIIGEVRPDEPDVFYAQRHIKNNKIAVTRGGSGLVIVNPDNNNAVLHEYKGSGNMAVIAAQSPEFPQKLTELSSRTTGFKTTPANNIYTGAFIYRAARTGVEVINLVALDDYIKGVVPYEAFPGWETEALRAFAITARSYAVHSISRNRHEAEGFAICNSTHCQFFMGMRNATDRTNAAVDDTRNLIIAYEGKVIEAVYHSSSGGVTENHNDAWGGDMRFPYLASVRLPSENYAEPNRRNALWTNSVSPRELYEYLVSESPQAALFQNNLKAPVREIKIEQRSPGSNYIKSVTIIDTSGNSVTVANSDRIRQAFSKYANSANMDIFRPGKFKAFTATAAERDNQDIESGQTYIISANGLTRSAPAQLAVMSADGLSTVQAYETGTNFVFDGKGWGHGVGMSQWAAQDMALLGYGYEEIIMTFYTGVSITRMTNVIK